MNSAVKAIDRLRGELPGLDETAVATTNLLSRMTVEYQDLAAAVSTNDRVRTLAEYLEETRGAASDPA